MQHIAMLVGRILMSAIFIQAAMSKLLSPLDTINYFESLGLPLATLVTWLVIILELFGGLAVLLGFRIRIAATVLGFFSIAAALIGHSDFSSTIHLQAFMKDLAIAGGLFYIATHGAGLISFDARREA